MYQVLVLKNTTLVVKNFYQTTPPPHLFPKKKKRIKIRLFNFVLAVKCVPILPTNFLSCLVDVAL